MTRIGPLYNDLQKDIASIDSDVIELVDHIGAFDENIESWVLNELNREYAGQVCCEYIFDQTIKEKYPNLNLNFSLDMWIKNNFIDQFEDYRIHPVRNLRNFLCTFNGGRHVSRKLLTAITKKFKWFKQGYATKNFVFELDEIAGHVKDFVGTNERFYNKFFNIDEQFANQIYSLDYTRFNHAHNVKVLSKPIVESFVHIVSETMATSYYPFVTEKFLYSVTNRGLFLAYAQPGWHKHLEKNFGFKPFKIFDYNFDSIMNPITRLVELFSTLSKFSVLSYDDWNDLYLLEHDTIEFNYDHFYSGNYKKYLDKVA